MFELIRGISSRKKYRQPNRKRRTKFCWIKFKAISRLSVKFTKADLNRQWLFVVLYLIKINPK